MAEISIKKDDRVFCIHRKAIEGGKNPGSPIEGKIIGITARANRQIAVELSEEVSGGHDCDGRGKPGFCIWCRPAHVMLPQEWEVKKLQLDEAAAKAAALDEEVEELVLRNV
tara:strand:- start:479 stop:814 length:336 start_codon:yes stop_codon:yes gene_type:complete